MSGIRTLLQRLVPRRLAGQMIALVLLALIVAQAANLVIFLGDRQEAMRAAERTQIIERTASVVRLIESSPPALHEQIARTASSRKLRFWLAETSAVPAAAAQEDSELRQRLDGLLDERHQREVLILMRDDAEAVAWPALAAPRPSYASAVDEAVTGDDARAARAAAPGWPGLVISTRLADGQWLNVGIVMHAFLGRWTLRSLLSMGLTAAILCVIVIVMVRRITRPMARLAESAERVGRGEAVAAIPEAGPLDIRQTIWAFNRMYERLQRFVDDRTRMLAAVSHDLRTPITSLRLRAEFIDDEETRDKILDTLDEMQRMTDATLAFAREESAPEETRTVDLAALVESLCDDLADMGMDVRFADAGKTPYACRPLAVKRAVRNLVENAVAYGERATVTLERRRDELRIVVADVGPGIPEADAERVFAPFVRLEESRSSETGGIGLGMAIARTIVRAHGGDITLSNRAEGGLRAVIHLPRPDAADGRGR